MQLYNFFRSGTSHRLRIVLNLKGVHHGHVPVDLRTEQHLAPAFRALNPQAMVPALVLDDGSVMTQSPALIEWLEERYPQPPLLPVDLGDRAHVRALAALVGCDIHPVNNRRILEALRHGFSADEPAINRWCQTWIGEGFDAYEALLAARGPGGRYSFGNTLTLADAYLVPQVESARRFKADLARWPRIAAIDAECAGLEAFRLAAPASQADAN